jgi:polysaccharide deacetylase family protein (PEP-CTERM system associated)
MSAATYLAPAQDAVTHGVRHIFSVDVEEYFQVNAFDGTITTADWWRYPSRVEASVDALLALLAEHQATATFFCLAWVAKGHPAMIRRIVSAGHEIASHGWWHRRVTTLTPTQFRYEVRVSKGLLEDVSGTRVIGYRAPSFSIVPGFEWALDILAEQGYRYDSSLFPIRRRGYGYPGAPAVPHERVTAAGPLLELPPATLSVCGMRFPAAGGGYLRQLPLALVQAAIRQHASRGTPAMLYIHPWELDPDQPRIGVGAVTRLRHYRGLSRTAERLRTLLAEFPMSSAAFHVAQRTPVHPWHTPALARREQCDGLVIRG